MNTTFILICGALLFVNLTTSKPIEQMDLELKTLETESQYSDQIHSIVKRLAIGAKNLSDTGIAGIITTEGTKNHRKKRLCEEWFKVPVINRWRCKKFKVLNTKYTS